MFPIPPKSARSGCVFHRGISGYVCPARKLVRWRKHRYRRLPWMEWLFRAVCIRLDRRTYRACTCRCQRRWTYNIRPDTAGGCGHGCCIPVMDTEQDAAGVAVQDCPCLVIRRSMRRTTVVFTIAAAAKLAFKDCPWCRYDFIRTDDDGRVGTFLCQYVNIFF